MKSDTKLFIGIIGATLVIVIGAVFFFSKSATPGKLDNSLLIRPDSQTIASASATVTLVEFADYQCPACGAYHPLVKQIISEFAGNLTFVYRNFPLSQHQNAALAAAVAEAAGKQGKFWEMHDKLFESQANWSESAKARDIFTQYGADLHLNGSEFSKDIDASKSKIDRDIADGIALGVNSTPTFYLDGEKITNPGSLADFEALIKAAIANAPKPTLSTTQAYHIHVNFKVYINGTALDFSAAKYQSTEAKELNPNIHLHDGNGDVIHIHKKGMMLDDFFRSLGIAFNANCLDFLDTNNSYCRSEANALKMFVNGKQNWGFAGYIPEDLDRILITYGSDSDAVIQEQIQSVADNACIYSLKCPERGKPPTENCVGGLGTGCKD